MNPMDLSGKHILITGASSGIGRAAALYCAELGARVTLMGRNMEKLLETRERMSGDGHQIFTMDFRNLMDPFVCGDCISKLFDQITADGNKLDGLVHCAGIAGVMPLKTLTVSRLHEIMSVNFYSFVEMARVYLKKKNSNDGSSIVGVSSVLAIKPREYELAYIASKAAMEAAMPVIAMESSKRRIRVNCIAPGPVATEMAAKAVKEYDNHEFLEQEIKRTILGWQQPEDIAKVCAFLLSDASGAFTAQVLRPDGGYR